MPEKLWQELKEKVKSLRRDKQEDDKQEESDEQEEGRPATPFVKPDGPAAWFYFIALASLTGVVIVAVVNERWVTPVDKIEWLASGFEAVGYILSQSGQSAAAVVLWSALIAETVRLVVVLAGFLKKDLDRKLNERSDKRLRKRLDKARKEGRAEGLADFEAERASQAAASTEWLARMQEAQRKGDPFDEEPPWEANGASES